MPKQESGHTPEPIMAAMNRLCEAVLRKADLPPDDPQHPYLWEEVNDRYNLLEELFGRWRPEALRGPNRLTLDQVCSLDKGLRAWADQMVNVVTQGQRPPDLPKELRDEIGRFEAAVCASHTPTGDGRTDSGENLQGFRSADSLWLDCGIRKQRLSEAARDGKVKTKPAPPGCKDSQGRAVRTLYCEADAKKHCSPKRVTAKTRRKLGLPDS